VPYALHLASRVAQVARSLEAALNGHGDRLLPAALTIARIEYPALDAQRYLDLADVMARRFSERLGSGTRPLQDAIAVLNEYLYEEEGFTGNRDRYDDPRNSYLNEVLDRRTGIPLSLAIIYLEVARRAGLHLSGVNFPGHFLVRAAADGHDLIIDPFHGGALLSELECRQLLRNHVGEDVTFANALLAPATRHDIVVRMLVNLKRLYVRMRSFPQARFVSTLLLTVDPSAVGELRDRGLLAYHLEDFSSALSDLEEYLRLAPPELEPPEDSPDTDEGEQEEEGVGDESIFGHVKALRRRMAGFN
jgi:regulator of sirC expression with transglutaminase-like and TPR domain